MRFDNISQRYKYVESLDSDIKAYIPKLRRLASTCNSVVEFGFRHGNSATAFLAGLPPGGCLTSYDVVYTNEVDELKKLCPASFRFVLADTSKVFIDYWCDLLFLDTKHTYAQLLCELTHNCKMVKKWILVHDVVLYGDRGEDDGPGLLAAIEDFLEYNKSWCLYSIHPQSNGLAVLSRVAKHE